MAVPVRQHRAIGRTLKTLIPLIQSELQQGNEAGQEHYRRAGEMLLEAKEQVAHGSWGRWLSKNFDMHQTTARLYMRWARQSENEHGVLKYDSLRSLKGDTAREREHNQSKQQQEFRRVLRDVARDTFVQERQTNEKEIQVHRKLAEEVIDIGYRYLATKLHPDRGGDRIAMTRLNTVREQLKAFAQTRRFV